MNEFHFHTKHGPLAKWFFFFNSCAQWMAGLWAWGLANHHVKKWKASHRKYTQRSRAWERGVPGQEQEAWAPGALTGEQSPRIHSRCQGLEVRRVDKQHWTGWLKCGTEKVTNVMEPIGVNWWNFWSSLLYLQKYTGIGKTKISS